MLPILTVFAESPDRGRGLARDMPVRWALEEVGRAYDIRTVTFVAMKEAEHRRRQPFGQIPVYEEGDLVLFESGAIVLHIAEQGPGLMPQDGLAPARARAISWMFAALNTIEPPVWDFAMAGMLDAGKPWQAERKAGLERQLHTRLDALAARLGEGEWLDGAFSAGDLMMISVLRRLCTSGVLADYPLLAAYVARGEARAAFKRAFAAQLAVFIAGQQA